MPRLYTQPLRQFAARRALTLLRRDSGFSASDVTDVPEAEAQKLIDLYNATDGDNWTDNTGWLTDPVANNWYGITVAGGHVTVVDPHLNTTTVSGDIGSWGDDMATTLPSLVSLFLYTTSVSGDIGGWTFPASVEKIYIQTTSVEGNIGGWTLPASLVYLFANSTSVSGDLSSWTLPAPLVQMYLYKTSVSGDISGWTLPALMQRLYINETSMSGVPILTSAAAITKIDLDDTSLDQTDVDGWLAAIYARRAAFTYATPALDIGGSGGTIDAAPSGTYQDGDPPTTGKEYIYEIANDPETEGFNTWSVVYNGGSAP